jgi:hypothetical protein
MAPRTWEQSPQGLGHPNNIFLIQKNTIQLTIVQTMPNKINGMEI